MTVELLPVETITPREEDAHAIEQQAKYVIGEIGQDGQALGGQELEAARQNAIAHAMAKPGSRWGVFKLVRDYTAEPRKADAPGAPTTSEARTV